MNILTFRSQKELNKAGAGIITGLLQTNPKAVLGLATGGTPVGIYQELVETHREGLVSFSKSTVFNLDEYVGLQHSHPESYYNFMQQHLLGKVDIPSEQCHIPDGMAADLDLECKRYDSLLEEAGQIDLQLLGIGHNGHIGFNEPDEELERGTHVIELKGQTRAANARFFHAPEEVPTHAITMGVGTILKAKMILLVVHGKDKAEIVKRALQGPITTECPASLLQTHPHVVVLLDMEAGSGLS
ncbi:MULTISPECIES: glucosamine-6-phosphate deaminase [unclassified Paenibacillus]|uniref:glucosamine-6-phosphate deaminase n=1 Tax=unclassified Paenibacillus TaxID=185978 RepID=UPI001AE3A303|nr:MULTISPECIES: glucosamine-6-phosphate deaminase [unclassified Paenibacillus]MBP1154550.1 glucosamine-6-phosphate deaminase [Paenibacillus sp. PvP091]MBP1170066.1 glucosamine-6-phosphate deaminase [Paenibacillus sp. PvR098]MBP2441094.1 glucosamine-6-phosphate deaminase [Paenibacillus sp. PvP052]